MVWASVRPLRDLRPAHAEDLDQLLMRLQSYKCNRGEDTSTSGSTQALIGDTGGVLLPVPWNHSVFAAMAERRHKCNCG